MKTPADFTSEDALALQALLATPAADDRAMDYFETAGFLFAVCCSPDAVQPAEWVPIVLYEKGGRFGDAKALEQAMHLLLALYNHVNQGVLDREPQLPWGCDIRADPLSNLEEDAPLSRWSRGFAEGSDWLQASWPDELPKELSDGLGACLLVLSFFANRELAEAYWKESRRTDMPLEAMAQRMQEMLPRTMGAYADLGRSIQRGLLRPEEPARTGARGRKPSATKGGARRGAKRR